MKFDVYKEKNTDKIQFYLSQGFIQKQIDIPLADILCSLNTIIWVYKNLTDLADWDKAADFIKNHMMGVSKHTEDPSDHEYLYREVRVYIQKDKGRINGLKWRKMPLPPADKIDQYADVLSELALHCIEVCVQEFKEEAKKMQIVKTKLKMGETEDKKGKEQKYKSNRTKTFLERLERIKSADEKWQEEYLSEKENVESDETTSSKKRKRTPDVDDGKKPVKKRVRWEKTVTGGNTNGAEYRDTKRKNVSKSENSIKCGSDDQPDIQLFTATKQTMNRA
jgi:hypothetical protein